MVVTLGNWLNGRLSCEQIEQLWCELIIPKQNKEQKESEFFTAATAITGIPSSLSATLHSFWLASFSLRLLQNRKKHSIIWPKEPRWSCLRRRRLGFFRLRYWVAPQGVVEGNEALCHHAAGTDSHRFSQGADRGAIPAGARNAGVRCL